MVECFVYFKLGDLSSLEKGSNSVPGICIVSEGRVASIMYASISTQYYIGTSYEISGFDY